MADLPMMEARGCEMDTRYRWACLSMLLITMHALADVPEDPRILVEMPTLQRELMRQEMQEHLRALDRIIGHLAQGEHAAAGELAESTMGLSTMGKHAAIARHAGGGPGRFMPDSMRQMGIGMHEAASRFATVASEGDHLMTMKALQGLTTSCIGCHMGYRTR